jgi:serine/threonine protein phosphatase PrpC
VAPGPSPGSEILWNVVGGGTPELSPEVSAFDLKADDVLLLATDGLTRYVPPDEIASALESGGDARETCRRLVIAANQAGGRDNVTVIVGRIANPEGGRADTTGVTARRMSSTDGEPEGQARTVSDRGPLHDDPRPPFNHGVVGRPRSTNRVH